jgi:hypothetical protein
MIITEQQYNSVVSGLRTQLELQRAHAKERTDALHALVNENQQLRNQLAEVTATNRVLSVAFVDECAKPKQPEPARKQKRK